MLNAGKIHQRDAAYRDIPKMNCMQHRRICLEQHRRQNYRCLPFRTRPDNIGPETLWDKSRVRHVTGHTLEVCVVDVDCHMAEAVVEWENRLENGRNVVLGDPCVLIGPELHV